MSPGGFLYRPLVFCLTPHTPFYVAMSLKPNHDVFFIVRFFSLQVVKLSVHFPHCFTLLHLLFPALRCHQSPPFALVFIHYMAFTPGSLHLGLYSSKHSLCIFAYFSIMADRNTSSSATIFLLSTKCTPRPCLAFKLFLRVICPPPFHSLQVPSCLLNGVYLHP